MQLGAVLVFDAGPLQLRHGGVDVERLRAYTAKRLSELPRARERRVRLALGALEVFAEDSSFQLDFAEGALAGAHAPLGNASEGAHRRIDWLALAAPDVAAICTRLGGTERDVVLAALAGGLRRVVERRVARADLGALRIVTPICVGEQT